MKTVFFDIDTQLDFLFPSGALYVSGAEQIAPALAALTKFAGAHAIPIVSSLDTHTEDDPEFKNWKPHCVVGTQGRQKWSGTLVQNSSASQILFEKNTIDFYQNAELQRILNDLAADSFVVYGLVTECCVRSVISGLLERKARVELVTDAIRSIDENAGREVLEHFKASGGRLVKVHDILQGS